MTGAGFPHSDIHGSQLGRQLPVAFRSLPRPSSASGAKASTVGSLYLGESDARARYGVLKGLKTRQRRSLRAEQEQPGRSSVSRFGEYSSRSELRHQPDRNDSINQVASDRLGITIPCR
jgi:hypothetical protein